MSNAFQTQGLRARVLQPWRMGSTLARWQMLMLFHWLCTNGEWRIMSLEGDCMDGRNAWGQIDGVDGGTVCREGFIKYNLTHCYGTLPTLWVTRGFQSCFHPKIYIINKLLVCATNAKMDTCIKMIFLHRKFVWQSVMNKNSHCFGLYFSVIPCLVESREVVVESNILSLKCCPHRTWIWMEYCNL